MKPANRSMEIVAVGLGQGGGNLAAEFHRRGYRALALNTAHTDLASLSLGGAHSHLPSEQRIYIGIDGFDGAGSDLSYGYECIQQHAELIKNAVSNHAVGADAVVLTAGLGGGTGSALSELIEALNELSLPLIALTALPHEYESGIAKVNAVRAVSALTDTPLLGWILIDNQQLVQMHGDISLDRYYEKINSAIIDPLDTLNGLNAREQVTAIRPLDGEDLRSILLSGGLINYGTGELGKVTAESVMQAVRDNMQYSALMPAGAALDRVSYLGLVLEASEETLKEVPFSVFEQINDQLKDETGGGAIYLGVYKSAQTKLQPNTWRLLSSSHSLPDGLQQMVSNAQREGSVLREKLQKEIPALDLGEIENLDLFRTHTLTGITESPMRKRAGRKSELNQERAETANLGPAEAPAPGAVEAPTRNSVSVPVATGSIPPPARPSHPSGVYGKTGEGGADRETFDRLMKEYNKAGSDEERKSIAEQLLTGSQAESSLVRYYAVRAMSKLDPAAFVEALQTAAGDEDATVRAVAKKALRNQAGATSGH